MNIKNWNFSDYSKETAGELFAFLPDAIFDAHAHPGKKTLIDLDRVPILNELPEDIGVSAWRQFTSLIVGAGKLKGGLLFALPLFPQGSSIKQACISANDSLIKDIASSGEAKSRCSLLVSPLMEPADIEQHIGSGLVAGLKPYVNLAPGCGVYSDILDFVPLWALQIAHEKELALTLHIQKSAALNDPGNIEQIHKICKAYPNMRLILAHCGCSFNVYNALKGAKHYTGLDNLYFDTSAVCESIALVHMFRLFPVQKFMWGTDFPISVRNGRFVGLGDGVYSLQNNTVAAGSLPDNIRPLCHGLESLRALVYSIKEERLNDNDAEKIFYNNAAELLKL